MKNESPGPALRYALSPGIIACVAGVWTAGDQYCLPINAAAGVIRASGCRVLVVHIPNLNQIEAYQDNAIDLPKLIQQLNIPVDDFVLMFNTSLCSTLADVQRVVAIMASIYAAPPCNQAAAAFLKLEILDDHLHPMDEETCKILNALPLEVCRICIPLLSGEAGPLQAALSRECPAIRIWCSEIGQRLGIRDELRLKHCVSLAGATPFILEGGLATPDDVRQALAMGFRAVLINSAFRHAQMPVALAQEIRLEIDRWRGDRSG